MKFFKLFILILFSVKLVSAENNIVNCEFTRTLKMFMRGSDVACLQYFLYQEGFLKKFPLNPGYYNRETKKAVIRWQVQNKIFPATGIFDSKSILFYEKNYLNKNEDKLIESLLNLPQIKDDEILISSKGFSDVVEYIKFYLTGFDLFNKINKDQEIAQYFKNFVKEAEEKNELPNFFSYFYIKEYIEGNNNINDVNQRLLFLKKFYEIKIDELKKVEISPNLKDFHKNFILSDYLEIFLINKFFEYQKGEISKNDLIKILDDYEKLRDSLFIETTNIINSFQKPSSKNFSFLYSIFKKIFFINEAEAFIGSLIPFGGKILRTVSCPCSFGNTIIIGPPRPAILFVPYIFSISPLNYQWKKITRTGVATLGLYTVGAPPCLVFTWIGCAPAFIQPYGLIFMSGTSRF